MSADRFYLISYDIADRRRWRRAHRLVSRSGEMQQFSVYLCRLSATARARLGEKLTRLLHPTEDRLMVVDLGPAGGSVPMLTREARLPRREALPWVL